MCTIVAWIYMQVAMIMYVKIQDYNTSICIKSEWWIVLDSQAYYMTSRTTESLRRRCSSASTQKTRQTGQTVLSTNKVGKVIIFIKIYRPCLHYTHVDRTACQWWMRLFLHCSIIDIDYYVVFQVYPVIFDSRFGRVLWICKCAVNFNSASNIAHFTSFSFYSGRAHSGTRGSLTAIKEDRPTDTYLPSSLDILQRTFLYWWTDLPLLALTKWTLPEQLPTWAFILFYRHLLSIFNNIILYSIITVIHVLHVVSFIDLHVHVGKKHYYV